MAQRRLLWIGQTLTETGYARISDNILPYLANEWEVSVLGVGYDGDPHPATNYQIFRADRYGDPWGTNRVFELIQRLAPDMICIVMEPWHLMRFIQEIRSRAKNTVRVVGYCVVDGENMKPEHGEWLAQFDVTIFPTNFALQQAQIAGFNGRWYIIPHGINPWMYRPINKDRARRRIGLRNIFDERAFVFGNVNENQPRKRLDLTIEAWANWWKSEGRPLNAFLYLHCNKTASVGWDLGQLAKAHGIRGRVVVPAEDVRYGEESMKYVYNALDVQFSTTVGEGWGFTTMEGMACSVPQIVPNHSALGEWASQAALVINKGRPQIAAQQQNVKLYEPDMNELQASLARMFRDRELREEIGRAGRQLILDSGFRWSAVSAGFNDAFQAAIDGPKVSKTFMVEQSLSGPSGTGTR